MSNEHDRNLVIVFREYDWLIKETQRIYPLSWKLPQLIHDIVDRYDEPWRKYHTIEHIATGFAHLRNYLEVIKNPVLVWWAWLLHDVVFVPNAENNEHCSAELACAWLTRMNIDQRIANEVCAWIRSTKHHIIEPSLFSDRFPHGRDDDLALLIDIDLAPLAAPNKAFMRDTELLQKESHPMPSSTFYAKQAVFASNMLQRQKIYLSEYFTYLENDARKNLEMFVTEYHARQMR